MPTSNLQGVCTSFKLDILNGKHAFGSSVVRGATTADTFKAALFKQTQTIDTTVASYTAAAAGGGEVSGTNYNAGGVTVTYGTAPTTSGATAYVTPSANIQYTAINISTNFDCVLIYNSTAAGKNAVSVHTFNPTQVVNADFILTMPVNAAGTALLNIA